MTLPEVKLKWRKILGAMEILPSEHPAPTLSEQMLKLQADIVKDFIKDLDEITPPAGSWYQGPNNLDCTV
jgi:hypothetical protein